MEDKHSVTSKVLAAIEEKGGNISFNELEESTGLSFTELSTAIGQLVKENLLLMRVNHFAKDVCPYKSSQDALYGRLWTCCLRITAGKEAWHSTLPKCASLPNIWQPW